MRWKRYPAYEDSGVEWLEEVPEHWNLTSAKWVYEIQLGKMLQNQQNSANDKAVPYFKAVHVNWGDVCTDELPTMWASVSDIRDYGVKEGDLLVCEGGKPGRAGLVGSVPEDCIIQNSLHRVRAQNLFDLVFLLYVLSATSKCGYLDSECNKATIVHFTGEKFGNLRIPWPPKDQRGYIASFLDEETTRIDALISKKQRQLELLEEKRTALITHAVTKGLDPNVKMKDSGVEWLEEVPEHWNLTSAKWVYEIQLGKMLQNQQNSANDKAVPYFKAVHVNWGDVCTDELPTMWASVADIRDYGVKEGDLLVCEGGKPGRAGLVGSGPEDCIIQNSLHRVRAQNLFDLVFLLYVLSAASKCGYLDSECNKATIVHFTGEKFGNLRIPWPPKDQRGYIASFLDEETTRIDALKDKIQHSIELLQEYRSALICAAVTGQIDVREEVM